MNLRPPLTRRVPGRGKWQSQARSGDSIHAQHEQRAFAAGDGPERVGSPVVLDEEVPHVREARRRILSETVAVSGAEALADLIQVAPSGRSLAQVDPLISCDALPQGQELRGACLS